MKVSRSRKMGTGLLISSGDNMDSGDYLITFTMDQFASVSDSDVIDVLSNEFPY